MIKFISTELEHLVNKMLYADAFGNRVSKFCVQHKFDVCSNVAVALT
jgi:hypothetical protein